MSATLSRRPAGTRFRTTALAVLVGLAMGGCTSFSIRDSLDASNALLPGFTQGKLQLNAASGPENSRAAERDRLLSGPVSQNDAVAIAMINSPAIQSLIALHWAEGSEAAQAGRMSNPVFSFERYRFQSELELGRLLAFGLLDLLGLPVRRGIATEAAERARLQLSAEVVEHVTLVRQAWVRAVAAEQTLHYSEQVNEAAQASAELARRMESVGNFNRLQRARQQSFYADASTQWALARHRATAARESLVRLLGLSEAQAQQLRLPERLPELPKAPLSPEAAGGGARDTRLDVRLAQANLRTALRLQGLVNVTSLTDIELGLRHDTVFDNATGQHAARNGFELQFRLPVFDSGSLQRQAMNARSLSYLNQLESTLRSASSQLREGYSAYRTAWDLSRHYRDEVVPLRQQISEENMLRYNGMLIGVFELLAETRDQISTVIAAINAQQQFWLADAALQAAMVGRPAGQTTLLAPGAGSASTAGSNGH